MAQTVSHSANKAEKKSTEVGQRYSPVDTQPGQRESGEPKYIERYEARIAPIASEQRWELMLKASYIFFGKMQALYGDGHQVYLEELPGHLASSGPPPTRHKPRPDHNLEK